MAAVDTRARIGAAALALAVAVLGPQTAGIAAADNGSSEQVASSSAPSAPGAVRHSRASARTTAARRHSDRTTRSRRAERRAATSRPPAAVTQAPVTQAHLPHARPTLAAPPLVILPAPAAAAASAPGRAISAPATSSLHQQIDAVVYRLLDAASNGLAKVLPGISEVLAEGVLLLVRRTFFDQAPSVHPLQLTGQSTGPITGTLGAVDPESDALTYRVVQAPQGGTVNISTDGIYTYTPNARFAGSDVFIVEACDKPWPKPLYGNWIDPRRPAGTKAVVVVQQSAGQA